MEAITQQIYTSHSGLLGKGLALSQLPNIHEALEGNLPFRSVFIFLLFSKALETLSLYKICISVLPPRVDFIGIG